MKICVIGSNGQLGSDLCLELRGHEIIPLTHADIEISCEAGCMKIIREIRPSLIINTAAFHNVPKCESEPGNAVMVNVAGAANLAKAAESAGAEIIHYSTDYVFDGRKNAPYTEDDQPNPLNFYAVTKLAGEHAVKIYSEKHKIIRIGGIYGQVPCRAKGGTNFVSGMLKQGMQKKEVTVVSDEFISPTCTRDIAAQTSLLIGTPFTGVFHMSSSGYCSWHEFASAIFEICGMDVKVIPSVSPAESASRLKRPKWSVMENKRLKELSLYRMRHWKEGLREHLTCVGGKISEKTQRQ